MSFQGEAVKSVDYLSTDSASLALDFTNLVQECKEDETVQSWKRTAGWYKRLFYASTTTLLMLIVWVQIMMSRPEKVQEARLLQSACDADGPFTKVLRCISNAARTELWSREPRSSTSAAAKGTWTFCG